MYVVTVRNDVEGIEGRKRGIRIHNEVVIQCVGRASATCEGFERALLEKC
jgi:hypothetical protein